MIINFLSPNKIVLPFKSETDNSKSIIENLISPNIYTTLLVGNPTQKIKVYITMDSRFFFLSSVQIDSSYYNPNISSTYKIDPLTDEDYFIGDKALSRGFYSNESFIFSTYLSSKEEEQNFKKFNNIIFVLATQLDRNTKISGGLGLQLASSYREKKRPTLKSFKDNGAISSYTWSINYSAPSEKEGNLVLGEYPHEYNTDLYNKEEIKKVNAIGCGGEESSELCWNLVFTDIMFGEVKVNRQRFASIALQKGVIVGSYEYQQKIEENYFNSKKGCKKVLEGGYIHFECERNSYLEDFPELVFVHQELMKNFILTKNDLFKEINGKIYFLVVFDSLEYIGTYWYLGTPFLKKYKFAFDTDNKVMFYYDEESNNNGNNNKNGIFLWIIIGILFIGVVAMVILIVMKIMKTPKRIKANEMEDDIMEDNHYQQNDNDNNNDNGNHLGV